MATPLEIGERAAVAAVRPRTRRLRLSIGAMLLAAVASVLAIEVALATMPRALVPAPLRTIETFHTRRAQWEALITGDRYLGFKLRPDLDMRFPFEGGAVPIRTVSHGLGDVGFRDIGTGAPYGAIVVGDSFAFCDEVVAEECWVRRLSDATGVSMATLGVSGYSTLAEARMLRRYGPAFGSRLVIVGVFPNDLADNVNFANWAREGDDNFRRWLVRKRQPHPGAVWLSQNSSVYRLLATAFEARARAVHRHREGDLELVLRFDDWWMKAVTAPEQHPGWPLMREALLDMRQAAEGMGARLAVVIFPTKEDAYIDIARRSVAGLDHLDVDRLPRLLGGFLAEHGIAACDVTGEIREHARRGRQLYYKISGHFNEEGNRVAAAAVQRCLDAGGLLPASAPPRGR